MVQKPVILKYNTEDFISLHQFKEILKDNSIEGPQEASPRSCNCLVNSNLGEIVTLVENSESERPKLFRGINYGRLSEGYQGPLVHLAFRRPIDEFSMAHIRKHVKTVVEGSSEDALYFIHPGKLSFNNEVYKNYWSGRVVISEMGSIKTFLYSPSIPSL